MINRGLSPITPLLLLGYVVTIENGVALPPIQVDGVKLVDGNHRYIAGLLCKQPTASIPWTAPLTRKPVPIQSLRIAP